MKDNLKYNLKLCFYTGLLMMLPGLLTAKTQDISFDYFQLEDGLPNNQIQCIYQDSKGWMWIGTSQGLSRFDGYSFVNFLPNPADSNSLRGNLVRVITEDKHGNLLVGTENGGLNVFDRRKERFSHPLSRYSEFRIREVSVNAIEFDNNGNTLIGTDFNLFVIDSLGNIEALKPRHTAGIPNLEGNFIRNLQFDKDGNLWIGTNNGVFKYLPSSNLLEKFDLPFEDLSNREIWEIFLDDEGYIWIGTYSDGAFLVHPETGRAEKIVLTPVVERSETVRSISRGIFGEYWIGTRGGLYVYSKSLGVTGFYRHDERNPRSLSNNSVLSIFNDKTGETWIGTRGGLNLLAKSKQVFHNFTALPGDNRYLNSNTVWTFWLDRKGKIWIGTEDGGINIFDPETETYSYLVNDEKNNNTISQNCIKAFQEDNHGNLWVGTYLGGIDIIDLGSGRISHFTHNPDIKGTLSDNRVWDILKDKNGTLWIATSGGVDIYDEKRGSFRHVPQINGNDQVSWMNEDSNGNIWFGALNEIIIYNPKENIIKRHAEHSRSMFEDSKNRVWITTSDRGIALYSIGTGAIKYYVETDGLANNQALCILEDNENNLWISTSNGLSRFNPRDEIFYNFSARDGLGNNQFCYGAALKLPSGEMLFGTVSGFNRFNPAEIQPPDQNVPLVFTDLRIFNKSVPVGTDKKSVLMQSISETSHLVLRFDQNVFTLEFAALNYVNSNNNLYTYKLEGFNTDWIEPSKTRTATYTNLNPGDYTLRIKRIVPGLQDTSNELQMKITILPPFWKTNLFLTLSFVLIILLIYSLVRFVINREKIKNQLILERINARKLHEIDMMKLRFFTNISHEIRTPLTLILGPLEKLKDKELTAPEIRENLRLMYRNAKNLDKLISQLLDFRKLQTGNLKLNLTEGDIVDFIRNIVNSFNDFALEKEITLKFNTLKKSLNAAFDPDKIEKILNNLISNAFKFTEPGGTITVNFSLVFDSGNDEFEETGKEQQFIEISVRDTGKGIAGKNLNRIFQRFFQPDNEENNSGVGIGLALVKELVEIHKGNVFVTSKPGKGTKFTFRIPYIASVARVDEKEKAPFEQEIAPDYKPEYLSIENDDNLQSRIMLIVEDNADVRRFISGHFNTFFKILEAKNGEEGWKLALENIPDIIISDIIMPGIDGYGLCKLVKEDERTSHIPVILLTALHSKEHEIKGITTGADDYITKPFDLSVLQAKVENLLSIRESLREKFSGTVVLEPKNVIITSPDERFLQRAIEVVEQNISNSDLDIEKFSTLVGVSRMQLYRKLHALTDMTVKEFIRSIRLKRAVQLLEQNKLNVSEVAYEVGFKDLSHFRKCFKREYGMSASEYIATARKSKAHPGQ